jgi:hypothetical protein
MRFEYNRKLWYFGHRVDPKQRKQLKNFTFNKTPIAETIGREIRTEGTYRTTLNYIHLLRTPEEHKLDQEREAKDRARVLVQANAALANIFVRLEKRKEILDQCMVFYGIVRLRMKFPRDVCVMLTRIMWLGRRGECYHQYWVSKASK